MNSAEDAPAADRGLVSQIGPLEVDWPRSIGYFGGIALAVAFEVIEPPLGLFIAAIPFLKMLNVPKAPQPVRLAAHLLDGAAKPVGGDSEGTVRLTSSDVPAPRPGRHTSRTQATSAPPTSPAAP